MRPRVYLVLASAACVFAGAIMLLRPNSPSAPVRDTQTAAMVPAVTAPPSPTGNAISAKYENDNKPPVGETNSIIARSDSAVQPENYAQQRITELQELSMANDAASLNTILSELNNSDPKIRKAALEATIQFGSRDAIPKLQETALQMEDPQERAALEEAANYLKLPSLTEVLQERRAKAAAAK